MSITQDIEKRIDEVFKKGKVSADEWNEIVPFLKERIIDISQAMPDSTAYIFMGSFGGVFRYKSDFYKVEGSVNGIELKQVNKIPIKEVFYK